MRGMLRAGPAPRVGASSVPGARWQLGAQAVQRRGFAQDDDIWSEDAGGGGRFWSEDAGPGRRWAPFDRRGLAPVPGIDDSRGWAPFDHSAEAATEEAPTKPSSPTAAAQEPEAARGSLVKEPAQESSANQPAAARTEEESQAEAAVRVPVESARMPPQPLLKRARRVQNRTPADFKAPKAFRVDFVSEEDEDEEKGQARYTKEQPRGRRLGRSAYDAMQTHGHFGLVDGGETMAGGVRRLVAHVPKRNRGYALDIRQGEVIYANSARGLPVRGRLEVVFVSRHKYVSPGHAVTSCVIGVPEHQWSRFMAQNA